MNPPRLVTTPNFRDGDTPARQPTAAADAFYEALIETHRELDDATSRLVNARLVLLLANHVGDLAVLRQALAEARRGVVPDAMPDDRPDDRPGATPSEGDPR